MAASEAGIWRERVWRVSHLMGGCSGEGRGAQGGYAVALLVCGQGFLGWTGEQVQLGLVRLGHAHRARHTSAVAASSVT
jgi:hypothetical protein